MPILAIIYAIFLSFILIASVYNKMKQREPLWYILLNSVCDIIVLWLFVAYWKPEIVRGMGAFALMALVSAIVWDLRHLPSDLPDLGESDGSLETNQMYRRFVLGLALILSFPGYWFGGIAAWKCL